MSKADFLRDLEALLDDKLLICRTCGEQITDTPLYKRDNNEIKGPYCSNYCVTHKSLKDIYTIEG